MSFPLNQSIESSNLPDFVQVPRFKPLRSLSSLPLGMDGRCERVDTWKVWPSLLVVCKVVQKAQYEYIKPILYIYIMFEKPNMTPIPKTWGFCRLLLSGSLISGMRIFAPVMGDLKGLFLAGSGQAARRPGHRFWFWSGPMHRYPLVI